MRQSAARAVQRVWRACRQRRALRLLCAKLPWVGRRCPVLLTPLPLRRRLCFAHVSARGAVTWCGRDALRECARAGTAAAVCGAPLLARELRRLGVAQSSVRDGSSDSLVTYFRRTLRQHVQAVWRAAAAVPGPLQIATAAHALEHVHLHDISYAAAQLRAALGDQRWRDECGCVEDGSHMAVASARATIASILRGLVR